MTTTIRARGPRELLAYVPFRLGYRPADSVVLVSLRPPRGRIGLVARLDVDDAADLEHGPQTARSVAAHLCQDGAERVVLVLYTSAPVRTGAAARERAAVEHCRDAVEPFLGEVDVWVVTPGGYYALDCVDPECCPPGGRPLAELESSEVGAHMVLAGATVADSREESLRIRLAPAPARRRAARAAGRWRERARTARDEGPGALQARHADGLVAWRRALDLASQQAPGAGAPAAELPAPLLGRLEVALAETPVRDAVLVSLVPGTGDLPERTVGGDDVDAATGRALALVVDPDRAVEPDGETLGAAQRVLEQVVAHGRRHGQAPALTLLAFLAWWQGDGGRAGERVRTALDHDPDHRLAHLVASALDAGVPPGWVRAEA